MGPKTHNANHLRINNYNGMYAFLRLAVKWWVENKLISVWRQRNNERTFWWKPVRCYKKISCLCFLLIEDLWWSRRRRNLFQGKKDRSAKHKIVRCKVKNKCWNNESLRNANDTLSELTSLNKILPDIRVINNKNEKELQKWNPTKTLKDKR